MAAHFPDEDVEQKI